jgi:pilus assembly protein Flp/PilA
MYSSSVAVRCRDNSFKRRLNIMKFALKEKGQGMVEYALILVLVAVVVIAAVTIMGPLVGKVFSTVNASL